jgi:cysteinylglycine-S-conjugate dipeptidase
MLWARPAVTISGIDISSVVDSAPVAHASAAARVALRVLPGVDGDPAQDGLIAHLRKRVPWNLHCTIEPLAVGDPFVGSLCGPAFEALKQAMEVAYGREPAIRGQGGSIPLANVFARTCPDAEIFLMGVQEPQSRIHAPNRTAWPKKRPAPVLRPAVSGSVGSRPAVVDSCTSPIPSDVDLRS